MIGPGTTVSTVGHPLSPAGRRAKLARGEPVTIGDDAWLGAKVAMLPGATIGSNVVVAVGAVVTKDVPDNVIVAGVPARVVRTIDDDVDRGDWGGSRTARAPAASPGRWHHGPGRNSCASSDSSAASARSRPSPTTAASSSGCRSAWGSASSRR
ncbi:DapH/DapD/GlmU-related protein [Propionibacterium acidifaciens]|uniref:DapH/DapD/GlmU-related protein n=1 Tax=Propionibacterium acidifaciens TaxID=556499 RepID=UPI0036F27606